MRADGADDEGVAVRRRLRHKIGPKISPAPGLLSTITGWPQAAVSRSPMIRARVSGAPPVVNVTTIFSGLSGKVAALAWAKASLLHATLVSAITADAMSGRKLCFMQVLLRGTDSSCDAVQHGSTFQNPRR